MLSPVRKSGKRNMFMTTGIMLILDNIHKIVINSNPFASGDKASYVQQKKMNGFYFNL